MTAHAAGGMNNRQQLARPGIELVPIVLQVGANHQGLAVRIHLRTFATFAIQRRRPDQLVGRQIDRRQPAARGQIQHVRRRACGHARNVFRAHAARIVPDMDALDERIIIVGIEDDNAVAIGIDRPLQRARQGYVYQVARMQGEIAPFPLGRARLRRRRLARRRDNGSASHGIGIGGRRLKPLALLLLLLVPQPSIVGLSIIGAHVTLRIILHFLVRRHFRIATSPEPWLVPLRECVCFFAWVAGMFGNDIKWGKETFSIRAYRKLMAAESASLGDAISASQSRKASRSAQ